MTLASPQTATANRNGEIMPAVVYDILLDNATPLPPGALVESQVIDVNGARSVHLMFSIPGPDPAVGWTLHFGPTTNNAYAQTHSGSFADNNTIALAVPVFGPGLLLVIENQGSQDETVDGNIYYLRETP